MNDQESHPTFEKGDGTMSLFVQSPPPDKIALRDESGQSWIIMVSTSGKLLIEIEQAQINGME